MHQCPQCSAPGRISNAKELYRTASFKAERRCKEIGVRKVMGGSVWRIVVLLTNDFSKLVLLATVRERR